MEKYMNLVVGGLAAHKYSNQKVMPLAFNTPQKMLEINLVKLKIFHHTMSLQIIYPMECSVYRNGLEPLKRQELRGVKLKRNSDQTFYHTLIYLIL